MSGNTIGVQKDVNFSSSLATPSGTALWSFYYVGNCPHDYNSGGTFSGTTRDIRVLTFKLSDFGITKDNYTSAVKFVQVLSGDSDVAFSAYSTNSLSLYCLENAVTTGTSSDTKTGITSLGRAGSMVLPVVNSYQSIVNPAPGMMVLVNNSGIKTLAVYNGHQWSFWYY